MTTLRPARLIAGTLALILTAACGGDDAADNIVNVSPTPSPSPSPSPSPRPTPTPVMTAYDHGVSFHVTEERSSTRIRAPRFNVGATGTLDGAVHCRGKWIELSRVHLFSGGGQRLETARCGPAFPQCSDIAFTWTVEAGDYEIEIERDFAYRWSDDYTCRVTLTYPAR